MKRRKNKEGSPSGGGYIVIYASLSILLLAFFIVLNSIATVDAARKREALGSLLSSFGAMPGGIRPDKGDEPLMKSPPITERGLIDQSSRAGLEGLVEYIESQKLQDEVNVSVEKAVTSITISEKALFAPGESAVAPSAYSLLDHVAKLIRSTANDVVVEGRTDDRPISTPRFPSNWELSGSRAVSVLEYLLKTGGISERRVSATGYGEFSPRAVNDTPENRAVNRSVSIALIGKLKKREAYAWRDNVSIKGFIFRLRSTFGKRES